MYPVGWGWGWRGVGLGSSSCDVFLSYSGEQESGFKVRFLLT